MRTELSDLLWEAAQDAPPPRYDVDDAVRAGKRRQRHRRAGTVVAAMVAVAVAVGVPQLTGRASGPPPTPAGPTPSVGPSVGPSVPPSPSVTVASKAEINFTFGSYRAGKFTVSDPFRWTLAGLSAEVRKKGGDPAAPEGMLTVYHPGVADPLATMGLQRTTTDAIGGRPAYFAAYQGPPMLVWQYADDAYAVVESRSGGRGADAMSKADLLQVAGAFRTGPASPVTVPFRTTAVPAGYRLVQAQQNPGDILPAMTRFLPAGSATARLADVDHGPEPDPKSGIADQLRIEVVLPVSGEFDGDPSSGTQCPATGGRCYRWLPGGKYVVEALCRALSPAELTRLVDGLEVADPGRPDTWFPANRAFPAAALSGE